MEFLSPERVGDLSKPCNGTAAALQARHSCSVGGMLHSPVGVGACTRGGPLRIPGQRTSSLPCSSAHAWCCSQSHCTIEAGERMEQEGFQDPAPGPGVLPGIYLAWQNLALPSQCVLIPCHILQDDQFQTPVCLPTVRLLFPGC